MLIRNYGLFWARENVFWGRPKKEGHLKGVLSKNVTGIAVDFREQQGVYVLYDNSFSVVYVGQAGANDSQRLFSRLNQHKRDALADRWTKFSWFGIRWVKKDCTLSAESMSSHPTLGDVLNHIEAILITTVEPRHNRQGGRFGENVEQYLQYRDREALGPTSAEMIRDLWKSRK